MRRSTYISDLGWCYNEPFSSESLPEISVLPKRFVSISEPSDIPIVSEDLNSISEPELSICDEIEFEVIKD